MLLGIATFRARVLPRWQGAFLAVATVGPIALTVLPHEFLRLGTLPMGCDLISLGYAL